MVVKVLPLKSNISREVNELIAGAKEVNLFDSINNCFKLFNENIAFGSLISLFSLKSKLSNE